MTIALLVTAAFASPRPLCDVPFKLINHHVYVPVKLNGRELMFMFDSGAAAPVNLIDTDTAREMGFALSGEQRSGAIGGNVKVKFTRPVTLRIGTHTLPRAKLASLDLAGAAKEEGLAVGGLLGFALLDGYTVQIDYPTRRFRLYRPGTKQPVRGSSIPLTVRGKNAIVGATLGIISGWNVAVKLVVDTGFDGTMMLTRPFAERHDLLAGEAERNSGIGGETSKLSRTFHSLKLGSQWIKDFSGHISTDRAGAFSSSSVDGYIGGGLLDRRRVTFDYRLRRLWLD